MSITRQNLSVIIVCYKSDHVIHQCINSIDEHIEVIVVDNSNNEEFKKIIEDKYKNVKCISSSENIGMGAGNNLGIKNVSNDFALILNPDVTLQKDTIDELLKASNHLDSFGVIAPISDKSKYPNYKYNNKDQGFDPINPFKVKSVDGFAMLMNLKRLKQIDGFNFFDENFFLYLENDDLCEQLTKNNENIYVVPKSIINHFGGKAVDPKYEKEIELSRNWHWMWSKFYFNKKHHGYFLAFLKVFNNLITSVIKYLFYLFTLNNYKKKIYQMRLSGLVNSILGKKSFYRPKIEN